MSDALELACDTSHEASKIATGIAKLVRKPQAATTGPN
jgi:hypothetical protein